MSESGDGSEYSRATTPTNDFRVVGAKFKCPVPRCGRTFVHHYDLRSHIRSHDREPTRPSSSLSSIRSTPESSGYRSDSSSREITRQRVPQGGVEASALPAPNSHGYVAIGTSLPFFWPSGDSQFESQAVTSHVWSQQTTHSTRSLAALSLNESGTAIVTPLGSSPLPTSQYEAESEPDEVLDVASSMPATQPTSEWELERGNAEPQDDAGHITQGTKRRLEEYHEQGIGEHGGEPKARIYTKLLFRGKIIHRDYADVLTNHVESPPSEEHSAGGAAQGTETDDPIIDARFTVKIQSGQLSCEEMFECLVAHGCVDLSSDIDPEQYSKGLIQGGAFGDIWKGKLHNRTEVAIKVWRFSSLIANDSKSLKRAMREIYHWSKVKHEYVQELMGVILFQGRLGMVSRWMNNGNLREYIHKNPSVDRYALCMQVATGIAHLHSLEMVHGDLKGANVLVSNKGVAKLSDFDHSIMSECSLAFSDTSKPGGGTTRWMAPELVLDDNCSRSSYTDVYALGMTMLEIITGISPYYPQCKDDVNVIKAIMKKTLPTRPMEHLSDNSRDNRMWELLLSCWSHDPRARPTAAQVVKSLKAIIVLPATSGPK